MVSTWDSWSDADRPQAVRSFAKAAVRLFSSGEMPIGNKGKVKKEVALVDW